MAVIPYTYGCNNNIIDTTPTLNGDPHPAATFSCHNTIIILYIHIKTLPSV